ncbi:DNA-binding transcriptional regulator, LysR family [Fictibacillus solisalsi]|uniref:DNA-binding transcriptional regulator, LysR family n=1 Tax=Fictibacillus solisalsi TaxID=459525 RepID=A0A1H0ATK3_9BACL|nr:LysR family transcriptional regulator [Fictibacillus solisalsi]SDN36714.1 DNA-binding transcriptional regulator, LysR family [Fictibacillus solisalsi]
MDIRQLKYFVEVGKQKSFTKAAQTLFLSQPSLSKMVKSLEDELEVQLVDRSGRTIELTDAGQAVYLHAQQILHSMNDLSSSLYDVMNLKKGQVSIGLPPVIGTLFFPKILGDFHKNYPEIAIRLDEHGAKKVEEEVIAGQLELGVSVLPVDVEQFDVVPFMKDVMALVVSSQHPLAGRKQIELKELRDESFIFFTEEFALYGRMLGVCRQAGFEPTIAYKSSQWDFITGLVGENLGVSFLPVSMFNKANDPKIQMVTIQDVDIPWHLGIIMKKQKYRTYAVKKFIQHLLHY